MEEDNVLISQSTKSVIGYYQTFKWTFKKNILLKIPPKKKDSKKDKGKNIKVKTSSKDEIAQSLFDDVIGKAQNVDGTDSKPIDDDKEKKKINYVLGTDRENYEIHRYTDIYNLDTYL